MENAGARKTQEDILDKPITGPAPAGPEYIFEPDYDSPMSPALRIGRFFADLVRVPVHWVRENIVEVNRGPKYYWYHRKYPRALPIDECYLDDYACMYEANLEYKRTFMVDKATLDLLRFRRDNCWYWQVTKKGGVNAPHSECDDIKDTYSREELNFFIKYGELHFNSSVLHAYNKQKHRLIMERRRALKGDALENEN